MSTALAKPSKQLKGMTATIRSHLDAVDRAREIYLAQMKRAEADYFERIKKATELVTGEAATETAQETDATAAQATA